MNKKPDMPVKVPVPSCNGYPNNVANTQTMKTRGTKLATKGTGFNPKCC